MNLGEEIYELALLKWDILHYYQGLINYLLASSQEMKTSKTTIYNLKIFVRWKKNIKDYLTLLEGA